MSLVDGVGCWGWVGATLGHPGGALFLDRDGVVVEEVNYLRRVEDVRLIPGAAETLRIANAAGWPVVLVTNQAGVARGLFGWEDFEAVQAEMTRQLEAQGARIDAVFACGYHEIGRGPLGVAAHPWRKPNPGMLLAAAERLQIDLVRSLIVGDRAGDLAAGRAAGLPLGMHVATGHGDAAEREAALALATPAFAVHLAADLGGVRPLLERPRVAPMDQTGAPL